MATFEDFLSEGKKLQIKRKYTENHPAQTVGKTANVRNAVLQAIADGVVTREEFNKILSELSADSRQWSSRNRKYFNVSEEGIKLSKWGRRILAELDETPKTAEVFEATVEMDAINPDDKDFLKFLKKNRVKIINKVMDGPGGGHPVITMKGKRKDLETVLADPELGWDDPDLAEYIEESVNEKFRVTKDKWPYIEIKDGGKKYEIEFDDYEEIDDHGNEGKDVYFMGYDQNGDMWEVDASLGYNYENSGEIQDIYYDTLTKVDESVVTEKFVKEFDKAVLDAETEKDVLKVYPDAEFYVGKSSHFFGELEKNLFFKAYYAKYYQEDYGKKIKGDFKITSIYSEKGSRYVNLYVHESKVNEKDDVATHLDNLEDVVGKAKDFFAIGKELDRGEYKKKYFYSDTMAPTYTIEVDGFRFAIINKKYVDKGDREVGDIAIGLLESMQINEGKKVTLKRRYTENHPAITAGQHAKIRNKILEAIGDGQITQEEFDAILKELSNDKGRWARRNAKYFNVSEEGISLSKFGKRIFNSITVNENKENKPMKNKFLFETFGQFVDANFLNEAFKSMRFAELFMSTSRYSGKKSIKKDLVKAFYNTTKVNLAKIEDEDILTSDPQTAYKNKADDTIIFYISDNEKENPYAPYDAYSSNKTIPGGGYLLAMATGKNEFYGVEWSRYSGGRSLSKRDNNPSDSVGISKKYKGWDATGLYNVKRIAEMADRAVILNIALLRQKYSTAEIRASREEARKGATAFKNDKDFRDANKARYHKILADKAASLPLDKMVEDAIDKLAKQISDGLKKGEKTQYNEIKIGVSPRGREVKARDASSHMSSILDDYARYVDYIRQAEESEKRFGDRESYYERESKNYAKSLKERIAKIDTFDYAW